MATNPTPLVASFRAVNSSALHSSAWTAHPQMNNSPPAPRTQSRARLALPVRPPPPALSLTACRPAGRHGRAVGDHLRL
eukprot:6193672-Pleurochrysis_carterae.AAC.1